MYGTGGAWDKSWEGSGLMRKTAVPSVLLALASIIFVSMSYDFLRRESASPPDTTINVINPEVSPIPPAEQRVTTISELRVFAGAGLMDVVKKHAETFEREHDVRIVFNFAAANSLYQQIASGAPSDVFMVADFKWTKKLKMDGLLNGDQYWNFTTNRLAVIMPEDNPKNITSLLDLAEPNTRIVVTGWSVPVGEYTNTTLAKIQKTWGNKSDPAYKGMKWQNYRDKVVRNVVSYEPTVSHVVMKVLLGSCDAGFAFVTDAKFQGRNLRYLDIPADVNTKATYGITVMKDSANRELAIKYVDFWLSKEGQKLLADYGFSVAS